MARLKNAMVKGKIFFRDTGAVQLDRRQFILVGNIWLPEPAAVLSEHAYVLVGSQTQSETVPSTLLLQILANSAENLTNETRKKHASQIIPLIHTSQP